MLSRKIYGDTALKERMEFQAVLVEEFCEGFPVELIEIENAEFTLHVSHMAHDRVCFCFMNREFIVFKAEFIRGLDERLDREGIVLGGDRKPGFPGGSVDEALLQYPVLRDDLSGISEEFLSVLRDGDAPV